MAVATQDTAVRTGRITRTFIYVVLIFFACFYLLPFFIMMVNSVKPLPEITGLSVDSRKTAPGHLFAALPTLAPQGSITLTSGHENLAALGKLALWEGAQPIRFELV